MGELVFKQAHHLLSTEINMHNNFYSLSYIVQLNLPVINYGIICFI